MKGKPLKLPNALTKKEKALKSLNTTLRHKFRLTHLAHWYCLIQETHFYTKVSYTYPKKSIFQARRKTFLPEKTISKQQIPWYFTLVSSLPSLFTASCGLIESCKISLWYLWVNAWQCQKGFTFIQWLTTWWNQK